MQIKMLTRTKLRSESISELKRKIKASDCSDDEKEAKLFYAIGREFPIT